MILNNIENTLAILVLYKIKLQESITYLSLKESLKINNLKLDLLVYDNSPTKQNIVNDIIPENINIEYIHDETNPGVSKAYNVGEKFAKNNGKKWLLLLDQDSNLPINYFERMIASLEKYPNQHIFAPILINKNRIYSPCSYRFKRGKSLPYLRFGINSLIKNNLLNSGLFVSVEIFDKVGGFNENIRLYFSDFNFIDRVKVYIKEYVIVDCLIHHNLSSDDESDYNKFIIRFSLYCQGAKSAVITKCDLFQYFIITLLRAIKQTMRFKRIVFLKIFYKDFILY